VIVARVVATVVVIALYVVIFVLYTRPILIHEATHLNWGQAFLWPFAFSVDYFLHTNTRAWIVSTAQP
jgi:hypothetical protein